MTPEQQQRLFDALLPFIISMQILFTAWVGRMVWKWNQREKTRDERGARIEAKVKELDRNGKKRASDEPTPNPDNLPEVRANNQEEHGLQSPEDNGPNG